MEECRSPRERSTWSLFQLESCSSPGAEEVKGKAEQAQTLGGWETVGENPLLGEQGGDGKLYCPKPSAAVPLLPWTSLTNRKFKGKIIKFQDNNYRAFSFLLSIIPCNYTDHMPMKLALHTLHWGNHRRLPHRCPSGEVAFT